MYRKVEGTARKQSVIQTQININLERTCTTDSAAA